MKSSSCRALAAMLWACALAVTEQAASAAPPADDGQRPMAAKDYASTRYSALDQITRWTGKRSRSMRPAARK